jgi:hypothetical protein
MKDLAGEIKVAKVQICERTKHFFLFFSGDMIT